VSPAAHYHMGGVATGLDGRTDLAGLFAAGEVAATGVHGANRLASNSLLEGMVFGARAGAAAADDAATRSPGAGAARFGALVSALAGRGGSRPAPALGRGRESSTVTELRHVMWRQVGLVRDRVGLTDAVRRLDALVRPGLDPEAANMLLVARLVARAALLRTESRGAHQRTDFPATDPVWARHIDVRLDDGYPVTTTTILAPLPSAPSPSAPSPGAPSPSVPGPSAPGPISSVASAPVVAGVST
jgi:L-aspartate oxidase